MERHTATEEGTGHILAFTLLLVLHKLWTVLYITNGKTCFFSSKNSKRILIVFVWTD
jgi:hypothetical protein